VQQIDKLVRAIKAEVIEEVNNGFAPGTQVLHAVNNRFAQVLPQ
jgi:hypothetical protein